MRGRIMEGKIRGAYSWKSGGGKTESWEDKIMEARIIEGIVEERMM